MKDGDLFYVQWQSVAFVYTIQRDDPEKWSIVDALDHGTAVMILDSKRIKSTITHNIYYVRCLTRYGEGYVRESALTQELRERMFPDS